MAEGGRRRRRSGGASGGADSLLEELTSLRIKLEMLMDRDFKAREEGKLRKNVFLARLSRTNKQHLEDASRLRDEAMKLCERWRQHRASDPVGLRPTGSGARDWDVVHSDSSIPYVQPIFDTEVMGEKEDDEENAETLTEANEIMADVQAKYEEEEKWLRERMDQLRKEAEEIDQFKTRLERGRLAWESSMQQEDDAAIQDVDSIEEPFYPCTEDMSPEGHWVQDTPNPEEQIQGDTTNPYEYYQSPGQEGYSEDVSRTMFFGSVHKEVSAVMVVRREEEICHNEVVKRKITESEMHTTTVRTSMFPISEPSHVEKDRSIPTDQEDSSFLDQLVQRATRPVDQYSPVPDQEADESMKLINIDLYECPDIEVVVNVSLAAAEVDFFCDCSLRERIVPILHAEATSVSSQVDLRPSRIIEIENEFLWQLTTSRQSSERATPSSSSNSRRSSKVTSNDITWRELITNSRKSAETNIDQENGTNESTTMPLDLSKSETTEAADDRYTGQENTTDGLYRAMEKLGSEIIDYPIDQTAARQTDTAQNSTNRMTLEANTSGRQKIGKYTPLRPPRIEQMEKTASHSPKTSIETMDTIATSGTSSTDQTRQQTLADTVRATQQLRKQLSNIVSTYDREVTYLLLSVENYRQQWKREQDETQKQLQELRKNIEKLGRHARRRRSSVTENEPAAAAGLQKRRRHKTDPSGEHGRKLKQYNPDLELAVGKDKLSEFNRQIFELHMKLNREGGNEYDKECINQIVTKILRQLLELGSDDCGNPAVSAAGATAVPSASDPSTGSADTKPAEVRSEANNSRGSNSSHGDKRTDQGDRKEEVQQVTVDFEYRGEAHKEDNGASVVAYIVPYREGMRRQGRRSMDNASSPQSGALEEKAGCSDDGVGDHIPLKLRADRNVISVTCERKSKPAKIIEATYYQPHAMVSDKFSIHEWTPPDVPRYVSDGEAWPTTSARTADEGEQKVQLASRQRQDSRKKTEWAASHVYEYSLDSGISLQQDAEADASPDSTKAREMSSVAQEDDIKTCHIHLHRYDVTGPSEFCRRSRITKRTQSTPDAVAQGKVDTFSLRNRLPSPARFKKPIHKTTVGEAVLAMGIQLSAIVMSPSKQWHDVAEPFIDTNRMKLKREPEYTRKVYSRNSSFADPSGEDSPIPTLPPAHGRRTVSERFLKETLFFNSDADENEELTSSRNTILRNISDEHPADHQTHRTHSEADVFNVKKNTGLRWKPDRLIPSREDSRMDPFQLARGTKDGQGDTCYLKPVTPKRDHIPSCDDRLPTQGALRT